MRIYKGHDTLKRLPVFIILSLLLFCPIWALDPDQPASQYLVDNWDTGKGLPANSVVSLSQTPDGYLWLATGKGLARFDGMKFSVIPFFQKKNNHPLETVNPDVLFLDKADILWIGTAKGLTSYNYKTGQFKTFTRADGLQDEGIRRIGCDMSGNLWISYWVNGVTRCSNQTFTFFTAAHGLTGKGINAIVEDQKGNLLFGARDKGVFIFKNGRFSPYPLKELENLQVIDMKEDHKGNLWIGTTQGLLRISGSNIASYTAGSGLSDDNVRAILEDSERNLWVGTDKGLNRLKYIEDGNITTFETFLLTSKVVTLFEDREKNLWVETNNEDLKQIKDSKFISYKPLETFKDEIIMSLFEDRDKNTWIGTIAGKLFHIRSNSSIEVLEPQELKGTGIAAISEDDEGYLWLGTIDNGVFQKKKGMYSHYTTANGLSNNTVSSIFKDSRDDLWFGTFDGVTVFRYRSRVFETFTSGNGLSGKIVSTILEDKNRDIWIGGDRGITVLKAGKTGKENIGHYLDGAAVSCIYEAPDVPGVYWIATKGAGLKRLALENGIRISSTSFTTAEGMATDTIYRLLEDWSGNFWMMSDTGILRVGKAGLNSIATTKSGKVDCVSFDEADGLADREFNNELSPNSALKTSTGELWFNTKKGISVVNPGKVRVNKFPPPVIIEKISVNLESVPEEKERKSYRFKSIENLGIYFTAPAFLSPYKIKFKYRLQGVDKDWIYLTPGSERTANYKSLPPGTFTFKVTACNEDGVWNQTGDSIVITREPAFYQTTFFMLFIVFMGIALATAAWFIYKKSFLKDKQNQEVEEEETTGEVLPPPPNKRIPLPPDLVDNLTGKLKRLVEIEKIYLNPAISLASIAGRLPSSIGKLKITTNLLSQLFNDNLGKSFRDFINSYRVEEAKRIIEAPNGWGKKNSYIAEEAGFSNLTVFYSAFKKFTGKSPTQYKNEVKRTQQK